MGTEPIEVSETIAAGSSSEAHAWPLPFAKGYPKDPRLVELVATFARGNYADVRKAARELLADPTIDDKLREAARDLLARTGPDRVSLFLLALTLGLVVFEALYWIPRASAPSHPAPVGTTRR